MGQTVFYHSQSCQVSHAHKAGLVSQSTEHLNPANRRDHLTPFRWFMGGVKSGIHQNPRKGPTDLTPEYLKALWEGQEGKCPFTGWALQLPQSTRKWEQKSPSCASLDRVDGAKPYIQGNVRFVSLMANLARQSFGDEEVVGFCRAVIAFRG